MESVSAFDKITGKATKRKMETSDEKEEPLLSSGEGEAKQLQSVKKKIKTGHKAQDSLLFLELKHNPFGKGVERNEWQKKKFKEFQDGKHILKCV